MKYYIVDGNIELMRNSFFIYRMKINGPNDAIIALVDDEYAGEKELDNVNKKLLRLEAEFRTKYAQWSAPLIKLGSRLLPKYSL